MIAQILGCRRDRKASNITEPSMLAMPSGTQEIHESVLPKAATFYAANYSSIQILATPTESECAHNHFPY